MCLRKHI